MDIFQALLMVSAPEKAPLVSAPEKAPLEFKYTLKTDAYTAGNKTTTLPIAYAFGAFPETLTVNWGDGTALEVISTTSGDITHTYAVAGTYQVSIATVSGKIPRLDWGGRTNNTGYQLKSIDTPFPVMYENATTIANLDSGYRSYICSYCSNLTFLPVKLFKFNPQILDFSGMFSYCTSLASLPQDLFWYTKKSLLFMETFRGCTGLLSLPQDLFKNIKNENENLSFYYCFYGCTGLVAIPRLWNGCEFTRSSVPASFDLSNAFAGCSNVVTVASDLFYNCLYLNYCTSLAEFFYGMTKLTNLINISQFTGVTSVYRMFYNCSSLSEVPVDYFRYNTLISDFRECFSGNTELATIPEFLLKYQTGLSLSYYQMFYNCPKLKLISNLFCDEATEKSTRFATATTLTFDGMFNRSTFTGIQGTAPDLWNYTLGGTVTKSYCFAGAGNSLTSLTNYADIPTAWKS